MNDEPIEETCRKANYFFMACAIVFVAGFFGLRWLWERVVG